jgi:hypothetical protein
LSCLCAHLHVIQCYLVHAVKIAKKRLLIYNLQKFAPFSSALFTVVVHSELSPHFSRCASGTDLNVFEYFIYLFYCRSSVSWWHDIEISAMPASVCSISGIQALGRQPSLCTIKFTACSLVSHSTAHNRGRKANFINTTFTKWELTVNTLHKVKPVVTTLATTRFVHITRFNHDLVVVLPWSHSLFIVQPLPSYYPRPQVGPLYITSARAACEKPCSLLLRQSVPVATETCLPLRCIVKAALFWLYYSGFQLLCHNIIYFTLRVLEKFGYPYAIDSEFLLEQTAISTWLQ